MGLRFGTILIASGGNHVNLVPSYPSSNTKNNQIWSAGADGLTRRWQAGTNWSQAPYFPDCEVRD